MLQRASIGYSQDLSSPSGTDRPGLPETAGNYSRKAGGPAMGQVKPCFSNSTLFSCVCMCQSLAGTEMEEESKEIEEAGKEGS